MFGIVVSIVWVAVTDVESARGPLKVELYISAVEGKEFCSRYQICMATMMMKLAI